MERKRTNPNTKQQSGGPRTQAGKHKSRKNALQHGLTSEKLWPQILDRSAVRKIKTSMIGEYQPQNPTEQILVTEMARHAAMMEVGERAEGAVLRHGASELSKIILGPGDESMAGTDAREDAILSAAVSTEALEKFNRYRRGHEKAFYAALSKLREIQADRKKKTPLVSTSDQPNREAFKTEQACEEQLRGRFLRASWCCPACGHTRGTWLKQKKCWQCAGCKRQTGLRYGTVMQGSRLSLRVWFRAIQELLAAPGISTASLAATLQVTRLETVRRMRQKIRAAVASDAAHELLGGLVDQRG